MEPKLDDCDDDDPAPLPSDLWTTNGGIYLGLTPQGGTDQRRPLEDKERDPSFGRQSQFRTSWVPDGGRHLFVGEGHVLTVGPQGSGKSRKLLLPNLYKLRDWSCVVIDIKGELCASTAVYRAAQADHRVFVVDPFQVMERQYPELHKKHPELFTSCGYNPLAALDPKSDGFINDVTTLTTALVAIDGARDPYWPMAAQDMIRGLLVALRVFAPGSSDSLVKLRDVLSRTPEDLAKFIAASVQVLGHDWPAIQASLGEFVTHNAADREIGGIRRTAKVHANWLDSPLIRKDLSKKNVIDFGTLKQAPTTVYLILPPGELKNHSVWLRLMVAAALRPQMVTTRPAKVPVLFMLDEIAQLGHMPVIEDFMAAMRGYGVKLWTVWQDVSQMARVYEKSWESLMATADVKITFAVSNDVQTREYFSRLSGERLYRHATRSHSTSTSSQTGLGGHASIAHSILYNLTNQGTSVNDSISEVHLNERVIKPYELAAMDADEAMIFARRGRMFRSICPQPNVLPGVGDQIRLAEREIGGKRLVSDRRRRANVEQEVDLSLIKVPIVP